MPTTIIRNSEAQQRLGLRNSSYYDQISQGLLPRPIPIGARATGQPDNRIERIVQMRMARKSEAEIKAVVAEMNAGLDLVGEAA